MPSIQNHLFWNVNFPSLTSNFLNIIFQKQLSAAELFLCFRPGDGSTDVQLPHRVGS